MKESESDAALTAVTPIDGRYRARTRTLSTYFSEFALIRYRVRVEIEWLIELAAIPELGFALHADTAGRLRALYEDFTLEGARRVKELERTTNHDVKAVEYFLNERFAAAGLMVPPGMVHFACTSEDINNLAYALMLKEFCERELAPALEATIATIAAMARRWRAVAMIARTHGQPATPTTMGKELAVFAARLERQLRLLRRQEYLGKFNGAVGSFGAHRAACPEVDWLEVSRRFVESMGLVWNPLTTQIESHDFVAELFDTAVRIDTILLDFARDMWGYIALGYFDQRAVKGEVGSSVMPHKVNPIDFENCEGNVGLASALFQHLAAKLPVSRWQRDLSDSTAMRAFGTAFGHLMIALDSLRRGLERVELNQARIAADLEADGAWEVLAEAVQTVMRRHGLPDPYERLKELTRGRAIDRETMRRFIAGLDLPPDARARLERLTPASYLGLASELVDRFVPGDKSKG
ncbi:MAG TPA: adenylosuccinate lyase [Candidatus Binataceae bacterium]|nr:adenylosuccinate lyase [Candidatus Binataceae bacterium]